MTLNIQQAWRKSFDVEFVEVTKDNLEEVVAWCGGELKETTPTFAPPAKYVGITDKNAMNARQARAFVGDLVLKSPTGFKAYSKDNFDKSFDTYTKGNFDGFKSLRDAMDEDEREINRSSETGQFVTDEEVTAHPETTVTETVHAHDADPS